MTSRDFCYWLQGYFEIRENKGEWLNKDQVRIIQNHLSMVFKHEIDPSFPKEHQEALNLLHDKPPTYLMTNQEIFNKVYKHLLSQRLRSEAIDGCRYRINGLQCAIGCLIPDKFYNPKMEGKSISGALKQFPGLRKLFNKENVDLLTSLQILHDNEPVSMWSYQLERVAEKYHLKIPVS